VADHEARLAEFRADLDAWRAAHPGWTPREQLAAFSPYALWRFAGGGELYRKLMFEIGYLVPKQPGDDGNLPCGWPGR
jgi:hypothetical protein